MANIERRQQLSSSLTRFGIRPAGQHRQQGDVIGHDREEVPGRVVVGFLDPQTMVGLVGKPGVKTVADEAESRLRRVAASLGGGGSLTI